MDKFKSWKRELKKLQILKKIVDCLPCTFSVLHRKTGASKPTLSRYLKRLRKLKIVKKEFDVKTELDIYYLDNVIKIIHDPFFGVGGVVDVWFSSPEYSISKIFRKGSRVKLAVAGKKIKLKNP